MNSRTQEARMLDLGNANQDQWNKARLLKVESELLYATERILPLVINQAMGGDVKAQKLILDRAIPPLKAVTPPLPQGLPVEDLGLMLRALVGSIAKGEVSPTVGLEALSMVRQAAELREGATPRARARRADLTVSQARLVRLEMDVASAGSIYTRRILENELVRQRKQLEAMNKVLDAGGELAL
jgi:hypothetical protein